MASQAFYEVIGRASRLDPEEKRLLIVRLTEQAGESRVASPTRRAWHEIAGSSVYPLAGEDAQAWVSRSRHEDETY